MNRIKKNIGISDRESERTISFKKTRKKKIDESSLEDLELLQNHSSENSVQEKNIIINGQSFSLGSFPNLLKCIQFHLGEEEVPYLCHHDKLKPCGSCRICSVEVHYPSVLNSNKIDQNEVLKWKVVASCHTKPIANMFVQTRTDRILQLRKSLQKLLSGSLLQKIEHQKKYFHLSKDSHHPYVHSDFSKCIYCYRCVRACDEIQGEFVLGILGRGEHQQLSKGLHKEFLDSGCVACGICVELCPTSALFDRYNVKEVPFDSEVSTTCVYCGVGCQLRVRIKDDKILGIQSLDHLCVKGRYAFEFYQNPDRLKKPLINIKKDRGSLRPYPNSDEKFNDSDLLSMKEKRLPHQSLNDDFQWKEVSWEEAYDYLVENWKRIMEKDGPHVTAGISSARATNEENYLMQKLFREVFGTNNIDGCARVCHAPTAFGMQKTLGTGASTNSFSDLDKSDCILLVGCNPTEAHPVVGSKIRQEVYKGKKLIVIDPRRTTLADLADVHLQVKAGGNLPLLSLFAHAIWAEGKLDLHFIEKRTEHFDEFENYLKSFDNLKNRSHFENLCGISYEEIQKGARIYGDSKAAMCFHGLGVTEHFQGSHTVMLLTCLALMTGNIGREGVGINPLRGQNNVQGAADMGVQPHQGPGYLPVLGPPDSNKGLKIPEMLQAASEGKIKALWIMGEDILQTDPNTPHVRMALENLDFLVVQELFMTETAALADLVLPVKCFFEKDGTFTNGERRVQRVKKVRNATDGLKSDGEILAEIMTRFGRVQNSNPMEILDEIQAHVPIYHGITWESLAEAERSGQGGLQWPIQNSSGIGTKILHKSHFMTSSQKARFYSFEYLSSPELEWSEDFPLILTTGRILEHYNCGSMTRRTPNRELVNKDVLWIHPSDANQYRIAQEDMVEIESPRGKAQISAHITDRILPGLLFTTFHFPNVAINHITSCIGDMETMTPEYKVIAVRICSVRGNNGG